MLNKYTISLAVFAFIGVLLFFWRNEIYNAAQSACLASVGQKTIETNQQSLKDANDTRKKEQSLSDIDDGLCRLGIMRESEGCKNN